MSAQGAGSARERAGRGPERADGGLRVAVLAGGPSSEHEVSLSSAAAVRDGLLAAGHTVTSVEIGRDGVWRTGGGGEGAEAGEPLALWPGAGLLDADLAFPVLHGPYGEDGAVQGTLETLALPYVGSGVAASALSLDKVRFKELMRDARVPQVDFIGIRAKRWLAEREQILEQLPALALPVFVKPAHLGSSVGIEKVQEPGALADAIDEAFVHDPLVIVEAMAPGIEVECAVLELAESEGAGGGVGEGAGMRVDDGEPEGAGALATVLASVPGEISYEGEFYDYEAKYSPGGMQLIVPARISDSARARVRTMAAQAFETAGAAGLARVDFFVDGPRVLLNELNTMPGFTPTSVYAKLIEASGIGYAELVDRLCRLALKRAAREGARQSATP